MTTGRSVGAEVDVAVDAETAFMAFTDEMDLWWVRGPTRTHEVPPRSLPSGGTWASIRTVVP